MQYIPPFEILRGKMQPAGNAEHERISLTYEDFIGVLKRVLALADVDEGWYLRANPDVERGIKSGIIQSARQHFLDHGYFEGRLPGPLTVDSNWYLAQYPDVADDVRSGRVPSAQVHFDESGYKEGRLPFDMER